ncbi:restriction endonuclease subunit S [Sporosarcina sp. Marseille-Q4063]|uniref:restriction endonuclease subunit S n=1 Tax=Sporosarcina sp. Marseille-Q4063 TaxID=2810514 RepID=UPI001BB0D57F|nr:restriction endonuclease subunit S [Sporosarcina sp. Marseille-Q4063]QUW23377.1 restriction endonuclease subunit S [Sporosarcina sp. Marseille-Q4063]
MSFKPYPAYKDSGIEWIGEIPKDWNLTKVRYTSSMNKYTLSERTSKDLKINYIDIGSVNSDGHITNIETMNFSDAPSRARRITSKGDIIVSTVRTYLKAIAFIDWEQERLISSTGFAVITPNEKVVNKFMAYLFRTSIYLEEIESRSVGVSYPAINSSEIERLEMILPPLESQVNIVKYLDDISRNVSLIIQSKEKLIIKLVEKRQAVITEAVTKGLDPNMPMKDSGVEWVGEIPAHWTTSRLDFTSKVKARLGWKGLKAEEYVDEGYILLSTPNLRGREIEFDNVNYITEERYLESPEIMLEVGDVLLVKDGSTLGITNVVRKLPMGATVNSSTAVIRPTNQVDSIYLYYYLTSTYIQDIVNQVKDGMGVPHLFQADIKKFKVLLPTLSEQIQIGQFLDKSTYRIEQAIESIQFQIKILKEYRESLIYEAVTGKIDLRDYKGGEYDGD